MVRIVLGREFHEDAVNPKTNPKYQFSDAPCDPFGRLRIVTGMPS
jgi:hypothetical protein